MVFQPDGGVLHAAPTVIAQARLAEANGATVRTETVVTDVSTDDYAVEVRTSTGDTLSAPVAIVAAGAWAGPLLARAGIELTLRPNLEQSTYFELEDRDASLPTLIDWLEDAGHPPYLVPDPWDAGSFKVGLHMAGPATDPDARTFDADPERVERVIEYVAGHLPSARATGRTDTCLYTITPDEDFVLDRVGPIVIASPCSGHGFKFVPLFGRALADLATGEETAFDRSAFRADRAGLAALVLVGEHPEGRSERLVGLVSEPPTGAGLQHLHHTTELGRASSSLGGQRDELRTSVVGIGTLRTYPRASRSSTTCIIDCFAMPARLASSPSLVPFRRSTCRKTTPVPGPHVVVPALGQRARECRRQRTMGRQQHRGVRSGARATPDYARPRERAAATGGRAHQEHAPGAAGDTPPHAQPQPAVAPALGTDRR